MILNCQNICKSFGSKEILKNVSFHIEDREKVALVGINGAGKSTLFKIIMQEYPADSGEVTLSKGKSIGYLAQHQDCDFEKTIYEEVLAVKQAVIDLEQRIRELEQEMQSASPDELNSLMSTYTNLNHQFELQDGYSYKSEIIGVLKGLGFSEEDFDRKVKTLSGGQKTRVALGRLLLSRPDIILLDEPTNHLDMNSISWLETFLLNYNGSVFIVSHDRYFLDKVVTKIVEIDMGKCLVLDGNYSDYAVKKEHLRQDQLKAYLNQQKEIKHQEEVITKLRSFNREKSIKRADSRAKMLDKVEVLDKPIIETTSMKITLEPSIISGNDVLTISDLSKSFGDHKLFSDLSLSIKRGERVALIGNNGTGKTTILKIINKVIRPDSGKINLGSQVHIGYYDQEHHVLSLEKTIFDEISDSYPELTGTKIRNVLAAFLFTGDDVFKTIESLSGGERGRVSLAKLMLSSANLLILDEPTNHLDIYSKEILESALSNYTGTVLYVSHDRYFINKTATRIVDLVNNNIENYIGNFDYYLSKKVDTSDSNMGNNEIQSSEETENKLDWKKNKEEQALKRKRENELKKVEKEISILEDKLNYLTNELNKPEFASDTHKLIEITTEQSDIQNTLNELYESWENLAADD